MSGTTIIMILASVHTTGQVGPNRLSSVPRISMLDRHLLPRRHALGGNRAEHGAEPGGLGPPRSNAQTVRGELIVDSGGQHRFASPLPHPHGIAVLEPQLLEEGAVHPGKRRR